MLCPNELVIAISHSSVQNVVFSELVVKCQNLIREFAYQQLTYFGVEKKEARLRATSCVSQRDIQVLILFYTTFVILLFYREYLHFMAGFPRHMRYCKCE